MKIESVSCRQFAGLRNMKPVHFEDGLNVVYGPNESGKSSLVGLIYSLLWQDCKVGDKGKEDTTYRRVYFPAEVKTGAKGNTIDGKLVIMGDDGQYTISKKWAKAGFSGEVETPSALLDEVADSKAFKETLKSLLKYGEGVYREAIFANQKTIDSVLQALLGGELKSDLSAVATSAMLDMGGISSEKFLDAIDQELKKLGNSWDFRTNGPKEGRGIDNKIRQNVGSILDAYYNLEEYRKKLSDLKKKSEAVGTADKDYGKSLADFNKAAGELEEFNRYYTLLVSYKKTLDLKKSAEAELGRRKAAGDKWPGLSENLAKAKALSEELERADIIQLWKRIEEINTKDVEAAERLEKLVPVDDADLKDAKNLAETIRKIENRLKNFSALVAFTLHEGYEVIVTSEVDGHQIDVSGAAFEVSEAVKVEIPGVVEFHLSAADLNVEEAKAELEEKKASLESVLVKYSVPSAADLEELKKKIAGDISDIEKERRGYASELKNVLGSRSAETLKDEYDAASAAETRDTESIQADINDITDQPIGTYISLVKQELSRYEKDYESEAANADRIKSLNTEIDGYSSDISVADEIPESFRQIADPKSKKESLESAEKTARDAKDEAYKALTDARAAIKVEEESEDYMPVEELEEAVSDCEAKLDQLKAEYQAWSEIKTVSEKILNSADANPLQQFEDDFREYLSFLSAEGVSFSGMGKKLKTDIYSGNNKMTYDLLSEGTKDTISLAFRLAVIKFLFPDGGGLAVFDDPFTDMDNERRARACSLLKEFSENNQIIFVTCDRSYIDVLGGNAIEFNGNIG